MLNRDEIIDAVEIQKRSYKLLRWLSDAIDREFITFTRAHEYTSAGDAAYAWLEEHFSNLHEDSRPERSRLREFANYFGSYVTSSFDLVENPGQRRNSLCGCCCPMCSHLENMSHLQVKILTKRDKLKAREKCAERISNLAVEENLELSEEAAGAVFAKHPKSAAYSAYGHSLLQRIRGSECRPWALALWRMIAWKPEGSPIKGFVLKAEDIIEAENELVTMIARS